MGVWFVVLPLVCLFVPGDPVSSFRSSLLLLGALLVSSPSAFSDIVTLKNGDTLDGVVTSRDNGMVTLRIPGGEIGFDAKLVESIDATKGFNKDSLAKAEDDAKKANEASANERLAELRARRAAVRASEASAQLDRGQAVDAAATTQPITEEQAVYDDAQSRLDAIDAVLATIPTMRKRVMVRRALLAHYFGAVSYNNTRGNVSG